MLSLQSMQTTTSLLQIVDEPIEKAQSYISNSQPNNPSLLGIVPKALKNSDELRASSKIWPKYGLFSSWQIRWSRSRLVHGP